MNDALLVLNPRQIPECIEAIQALGIPTCWISNMNETDAAQALNQAVHSTDMIDRYIVLSDDTVPTREALDLVRNVDAPAVTGYCNLDTGEYADIVNLTTNPLPPPPATGPSYHFMTRTQVEQHHQPTIPTTFAGLALTMMPRPYWQQFPFQVDPITGGQMDYDLSYRLQSAGIPIVAAVGAYVHHVKETWCRLDKNPAKRLLVGIEPPSVTWTNLSVPA